MKKTTLGDPSFSRTLPKEWDASKLNKREVVASQNLTQKHPRNRCRNQIAIVPASMARTPSAPGRLPPLGRQRADAADLLPDEPSLANPHSANVAMVNERGASAARCAPSAM